MALIVALIGAVQPTAMSLANGGIAIRLRAIMLQLSLIRLVYV